MSKSSVKLVCITALLAVLCTFYFFYQPRQIQYFSYLCKIYNKDGKLIADLPNFVFCEYSSDGKILASNPFRGELALIGINSEKIWSSKEFIHHDMKFSDDQKSILAISSEVINYQNGPTRSDCVSQRDLSNLIIHQWCLSDHFDELNKLGFNTSKRGFFNNFTGQKVDMEITHANSIYEIPENKNSKKKPAFSKGNFIVNLYGITGALIILDSQMKNILWSLNFFDFWLDHLHYKAHTHDIQLLSNGNILAYVNSYNYDNQALTSFYNHLFQINNRIFQYRREVPHSKLIEFDPIKKEITWEYQDSPPENFYAKINGTVTKIGNNYIYSSLNSNGIGEYIEINSKGEKLWTFQPSQLDSESQKPILLIKAKPLRSLDYLDAKNLLD